MTRIAGVSSLAAVAMLVAGASGQQATVVPYVGLAAPSQIANSTAVGVDGAGRFVGMTNMYGYFDQSTQTSYPGVTHAFLSPSPASAMDLGVLGVEPPPFTFPRGETFAHRVSALGRVACEATDAASTSVPRAALWLPNPAFGMPTGLNVLPSLNVPYIDRAFGVNDMGQLVGESRNSGGDIRPVIWTCAGGAAAVADLAPGFGPNGRAFAVNNLGQAVGQVNEPDPEPFNNYFQAFLFLPAPAYGLPAGVTVLQAPGVPTYDNLGFPNDINDQGQVVGRTAGFNWTPAMWLPAPAFGLPAGVTVFARPVFPDAVYAELGAVALGIAEFTSINNQGVAVGEATLGVPVTFPRPGLRFDSHAFIWRNGRFELLEDLLPLGSPWARLFRAVSINDNGEIAVNALSRTGEYLAVKITLDAAPCPSGFLRHPSPATVCAGEDAEFTVWAVSGGGGDLAYEWRKSGTAVEDGFTPSGSEIFGSHTNRLIIRGANSADIGTYTVAINNTCGSLSSNGANLSVTPLVAITQQPVGAVVCSSGAASFSVAADGGLGYQWEVQDPSDAAAWWPVISDPMSVGAITFGATGMFDSTIMVSNVQGLAPGSSLVFRCQVVGDCGAQTSDEAAMTFCAADFNCSGAVSVQDVFDFLAAYFSGDARADFNGAGGVSVQDIFDFLAAYFAGCR